jgi:3D (Asp-Asp-Asp) domain-containing protein
MRDCLNVFLGLLLAAGIASAALAQENESGEKTVIRTERVVLPFSTSYKTSREVAAGEERIVTPGKQGFVERTFEVTLFQDKFAGRQLVKVVRQEPVNRVVLRGVDGFSLPEGARGRYVRARTLTMVATAYDCSRRSNGGSTRTATGEKLREGIVAVDPDVIPLGTVLYISGYGMAIASDTGGSIHGHRIDVCFESRSKVNEWGRRSVTVQVLRAAR